MCIACQILVNNWERQAYFEKNMHITLLFKVPISEAGKVEIYATVDTRYLIPAFIYLSIGTNYYVHNSVIL